MIRSLGSLGNLYVGSAIFIAAFVSHILRRARTRSRWRAKIRKIQAIRQEQLTFFSNKLKGQNFNDLILGCSIEELKTGIREGTFSDEEVLAAFQLKALRVNEQINALTAMLDTTATVRALDQNQDSKMGLLGIPVSLKENIHLAGGISTAGLLWRSDVVAKQDAAIVDVLKDLGAVPFCRTNLSQATSSMGSSNPIFGLTHHPTHKDLHRTPGGSSCGEAALIASGGSPLGIGTDLGGSVRIPAAFSGIASLKTTSGRLPLRGQENDGGQIGVVGVANALGLMARSGEDIEVALREITNAIPRLYNQLADPRVVPMSWRNDIEDIDKIGWYDCDGMFPSTPPCKRAVRQAVQSLEKQGYECIEYRPTCLSKVVEVYGKFRNLDGGAMSLDMMADGPDVDPCLKLKHTIWSIPISMRNAIAPVVRLFSPRIAALMTSHNEPMRPGSSWRLMDELRVLKQEIMEEMRDLQITVLLCPVFPTPAPPNSVAGWLGSAQSYTTAYNALDFPAGTVKITEVQKDDIEATRVNYPGNEFSPDVMINWAKEATADVKCFGLPIGVQIVGRPYAEETVLHVMKILEREQK